MRSFIFSLFIIAAWAGATGWAQSDQTGMISGRVTDTKGNVLPGVTIAASWQDGSHEKSTFTDEEGAFRLPFLTPGKYDLKASMDGFKTTEVKRISVGAGRSTNLSITLILAVQSESMVVTAREPLIDTGTTEYATTLGETQIDRLPVGSTATDMAAFTPGVRNSQAWGGSTAQANSYQLDGVTVNSPGFGGSFLLPNVRWVKEFQVKGLGAGAEYGNFQGGLINMVTRSGGNTFEGAVEFLYENDSLNGSNLVPMEDGAEDVSFEEVNADVAGAIIKDRLYYFFSVQQREIDTNVVDIAGSTPTDIAFLSDQEERIETKLLGKLTWQATSYDSFNLMLGMDDVETTNRGLDSFTSVDATTTQDSPAVLYNLSWERLLGGFGTLEVKLTGYDGRNDFEPRNGDTAGVQILGGNREAGRNAAYRRSRDLSSNGLAVNFNGFFDWGGASHHLKAGVDYNRSSWLEHRVRNGGMTWRPEEGDGPFDFNDPATWGFISSDWGGDIRLDTDTVNAAAYVQDYLDFGKGFQLSGGLRLGRWEGDVNPGFGGGPAFNAVSDQAVDPRIGFVWDVRDEGEWVLKGHWGRFHQSIFSLLFDRVTGVNAFQDTEYWDWNGEGLPDLNRNYTREDLEELFTFYDSEPASSENGPVLDYDQPYVDQITFGVEKKINDVWKVGVTYVNRVNEEILALVDRNLESNYTTFHNVAAIDYNSGEAILGPNGQPLVLPTVHISNADILERGWAPGMTDAQVAALTYDQDLVLTNVDEAERELNQVQMTADAYAGSWDFGVSLTWSELNGNFYSVSGYEDPFGTGAGAFVEPNEQTNFNGAIRNISEWEGKLRFSADLPWGMRTGVFVRYDSGDAYTPSFSIDSRNIDFIAEDGEYFSFRHFSDVNGESIFLEERGSRTFDSVTRVDVHLDKSVKLGSGIRVIFGVDAFNLFNGDTVLDVKRFVNDQVSGEATTQFGAVRERQTPRVIRLTAGLRW